MAHQMQRFWIRVRSTIDNDNDVDDIMEQQQQQQQDGWKRSEQK